MAADKPVSYDRQFYESQMSGSLRAAEVVLGLLFKEREFPNVADIGCGVGTWLRAALSLGAGKVIGVDGSPFDPEQFVIPQSSFVATDLEAPLPDLKALCGLEASFDLVICMEAAEHLTYARAHSFIDELCSLGDFVLFSAAVPFQGGQNHFNEQWPEYWALHFRRNGFDCHDWVRPRVWGDQRVEWWYQQNALLFVRRGAAPLDGPSFGMPSLALVHPENYLSQVLTWFHRHRFAAAAEERSDLQALNRAYRDVEGEAPALSAIARAQSAPGALDVFPNTRIDRFFPEVELARLQQEISELRSELARCEGERDAARHSEASAAAEASASAAPQTSAGALESFKLRTEQLNALIALTMDGDDPVRSAVRAGLLEKTADVFASFTSAVAAFNTSPSPVEGGDETPTDVRGAADV